MRLARCVLVIVLGFVALLSVPTVASAHDDEETEEGYLLVQQALGHLAHDTSHEGIELAMEKVGDALETEDQEGVDVAEVEQAMGMLEAGEADRARDLLQDSIEDAVHDLPPATGNQTGTTVVVPELPGKSDMGGQEWGFLAASIAVLLLGALLALRFRPRDRIGDLRRTLEHPGTGEGSATAVSPDGEGRV
jgi:hypothetical protein